MHWATVPEAAIDEYGNPRAPEHHVGTHTHIPRLKPMVHQIAEAARVEQSANGELWARVHSAIAAPDG
jgi:hypothetical protein